MAATRAPGQPERPAAGRSHGHGTVPITPGPSQSRWHVQYMTLRAAAVGPWPRARTMAWAGATARGRPVRLFRRVSPRHGVLAFFWFFLYNYVRRSPKTICHRHRRRKAPLSCCNLYDCALFPVSGFTTTGFCRSLGHIHSSSMVI
jgi:hypothetical protein